MTATRSPRRMLVAALVVVPLAAGCGGCGGKPAHRTALTRERANPVVMGPGRLVGIGGGRSLYLSCRGSGSPTVVLAEGFGASTDTWSSVQPRLGRTTQVCAYDRAGSGYSLGAHGVQNAGDEVRDLRRLLDRAHIPSPYVLVGHSYGGLVARLFAGADPGQSAGVVLVDAMGRDEDPRFVRLWRAQPPRIRRTVPAPDIQAVEDGIDIPAGERLADKVTTLGATPLAVVSHGTWDAGAVPPAMAGPMQRLWGTMQDELASLSSDHVHVVASRSGHFIQRAQPAVVVRAVRAVVQAARSGTHLPPCSQVFRGAGVRCRD